MTEVRVGIYVDYESALAKSVAEGVWSGLSRAALDSGHARISTFWEGLNSDDATSLASSRSPSVEGEITIFAIGQDHPDAMDEIEAMPGDRRIYGLVVAVPDVPSPLAGSLLYQGVERIKRKGVRAAAVEPALLHASPRECESYARRLLERLRAG